MFKRKTRIDRLKDVIKPKKSFLVKLGLKKQPSRLELLKRVIKNK